MKKDDNDYQLISLAELMYIPIPKDWEWGEKEGTLIADYQSKVLLQFKAHLMPTADYPGLLEMLGPLQQAFSRDHKPGRLLESGHFVTQLFHSKNNDICVLNGVMIFNHQTNKIVAHPSFTFRSEEIFQKEMDTIFWILNNIMGPEEMQNNIKNSLDQHIPDEIREEFNKLWTQ